MEHAPPDTAQSSECSKSQWEFRRQQITRLYRDENMKLREVMAIMRDQGFIATERMYKDRMKKWGVTKNIKEHEAVVVLQIKSQRDIEGKKTLIGKHEQGVELERFIRHAKRKGLQIEGQSPASIP
ncbi:Clr5 domain-containing protein, partial [Leptodontidium sp. 2 PMI_412]